MKIKNGMIISGRNRIGVQISKGPWIAGVPEELIKLRSRKASGFPDWVREQFKIENNSDSLSDYFENDSIRLMPGDPLYDDAKGA